MRDWEQTSNGEDSEALRNDLNTAARELSTVVQVTRAGEAGLTSPELLLAQHSSLVRLNEGLMRVEDAVDGLREEMKSQSSSFASRALGKGKGKRRPGGGVEGQLSPPSDSELEEE